MAKGQALVSQAFPELAGSDRGRTVGLSFPAMKNGTYTLSHPHTCSHTAGGGVGEAGQNPGRLEVDSECRPC